ncbi:hypothetical protein ACQYE5_003137 [Enterobacter cancerogenus]
MKVDRPDTHDRRPQLLPPDAACEGMRQDAEGKARQEIITGGTLPYDKFI